MPWRPCVHRPTPGTRSPGAASGACVVVRCSPRSRPLAPPTVATATIGAALFAGFTATTAESDFSSPFIVGYGSSPSQRGPRTHTGVRGQAGDLPVPVQRAYAHARFCDHAGPSGHWRCRTPSCCLPLPEQCRRPGLGYRGSMAGLCTPLSTLRLAPRGSTRMTRGRCDSPCLHREGLSPFALCRSPGGLRSRFRQQAAPSGADVFIRQHNPGHGRNRHSAG